MFLTKRAVSPLIASVLLIVVVVGIGAVVTSIVRGFVTENRATIDSKSDAMACSRDVVLETVKIGGVPQVCNGSNYVNIVLENTGSADIDDFQLVVLGDSGIYTNDSVNTGVFARGAALEVNAGFDPSAVGAVEQVKLVPKLKKSGAAGYNYCTDVAEKYEGLDTCV